MRPDRELAVRREDDEIGARREGRVGVERQKARQHRERTIVEAEPVPADNARSAEPAEEVVFPQ